MSATATKTQKVEVAEASKCGDKKALIYSLI